MPDKANTRIVVHRDYILNVHDGTSELIRSMRKIMLWQKMREVCLARTTCKGCRYYASGVCYKQSTDEILQEAKTVFKRYIIEIEV